MLEPILAQKTRKMLADGISQRKIAEMLGISRTAVKRIATGNDIPKRKSDFEFPSGKPSRCPSCGGFVKQPCLACQLKTRVQNGSTAEPERELTFEFAPRERARYEAVKAKKRSLRQPIWSESDKTKELGQNTSCEPCSQTVRSDPSNFRFFPQRPQAAAH